MEYTVKSLNTLNYISLHDCIINHVEWQNDNLTIYFDWIDVMKTHPANCTGKAKRAYNTAIIFEHVNETYCFYYDLSRAFEEGKRINKQSYTVPQDAEKFISTIAERCKNVEVDDANERREDNINYWSCSCQNDTEFEITFSNVWVCFNALSEDSWFEFQP